MNYREKYQKHFNIQLDKYMHVHHIDFNKNNNKIENLIAVPKDVHTVIHQLKCKDREEIIKYVCFYEKLILNELKGKSLTFV